VAGVTGMNVRAFTALSSVVFSIVCGRRSRHLLADLGVNVSYTATMPGPCGHYRKQPVFKSSGNKPAVAC
jgi:hypothetical protein